MHLIRLLLFVIAGYAINGQLCAAQSSSSSMRQHYDAAYRYQTSGNYARADVEHALFVTETLGRLANFYANTGDYLHAAPVYEEALKLDPARFSLLMDYAGAAVDAHDAKKAKSLLQSVMELDQAKVTVRQKADVHLMLGRACRALGDKDAAIEQFRASISIDPNIDNYTALAGMVLEKDGHDRATTIFTEIIERFGNSTPVHMRIGRVYALSAFPDRAIVEFKKAIALDYKYPGVHYSLGAAYMSNLASDLPLAEAEFHKELSLHPDDTLCDPQLGYIALRRLNFPQAEVYFKRAIVSNPLNAAVFADLGKLYADTKRPLEAEAALRKAIALTVDPSQNEYGIERVHYQLGRLLLARGQNVEGERELQIAQELLTERDLREETKLIGKAIVHSPLERTRVVMPKDVKELDLFAKQVRPLVAGSYNNMGVHKAMAGKYAEAAVYFLLAEKWDPSLAGVDRNWGRAAYAAQDCTQAIGPLSRVVLANPSDTELSNMLKQCRSLAPYASQR
ncbi:MAG TPA: tetratricopeptide repeat protein [Terriglobales bacterium]|nr:tetratricopeptide repeat protein [Terriglobales bacterium]